MTYEFKNIVTAHIEASALGLKTVLATVVDLDGSSYRKPGVRMLIIEDNSMVGAVSGGCVEKDILRQSQTVFETGQSKMMTYDGRYRLGCEGVLYILLERFEPDAVCFEKFQETLQHRTHFRIHSFYKKEECVYPGLGSVIEINDEQLPLSQRIPNEDLECFTEKLSPCFKLMIFGAEHDAVKLCRLAHFNGWEVTVVSGPLESKTITDFPGATAFYSVSPDQLELEAIDEETAIVLMSHNFANDLKYLLELKDTTPIYLGLLGPSKRREKLLAQFIEYCPEVSTEFLDVMYGPAGLNIGAETPEEIAISIVSEILSVIRNHTPMSLKDKRASIHSKTIDL
jgi:xanthine/CO dehydrogenase XdhC/CoxF family maturation factor